LAITDRFVNDFKERMRIGDYEDDNLKRILEASEQDLLSKCGEFDIETHHGFRELVYERARYVYNDALEFFNTNFQSQINALGMEKALSMILVDADGNEIEVVQE
jgi:hypothetical protein